MADKQDWRLSLAIPAIGFLGVLLGATLQHVFSINRERVKVFEEREREAYATFLTALEKGRLSRTEEEQGRMENAQRLRMEYDIEAAAAVRRIAVYGDAHVIAALKDWYERPPQLQPCGEGALAVVAAAKAMRDISRPDQSVSIAMLSPLVQFCTAAAAKDQ
jgi:multidrug efflux pump subunit AcrB